MSANKQTITKIQAKKQAGEKITMLTAYDYPLARLIDQAGVDMILVGDSVANVVLGLESTRDVGMAEMLHHTKAVSRAVERSLIIGDMPHDSLQKPTEEIVADAKRFLDEAGADAVKIEWFEGCLEAAGALVAEGIEVMGHVGLTPQTAENFKVQGKNLQSAKAIFEQSKALEAAGCFSLVLECIPTLLATKISTSIHIPTMGIGAGVGCDGQVLVTHDVLGLFDRFQPKFAKQYIHLSASITEALAAFVKDIQSGAFPTEKHSFNLNEEEAQGIEEF